MKNMYALCIRDVRSYFSSVIAYAVLAVFLVLVGIFFFNFVSYFSMMSIQLAQQQDSEMVLNLTEAMITPFLMNVSIIMLFMLPMLTMRSFAEEKKTGTIELLFTYPLTDRDIVLGKFFAVVSMFLTMLLPLLSYPFLLKLVGGDLSLPTYFTGMFGLLLMGMSFIALGVFVSALTENQVVAVVVTFGFLLFCWVIGWVSSFVSVQMGGFLTELSIMEHFKSFALGMIDTQDVLFYVLFIAFFLFWTLRVLESRNWRG